MGHVRQVHGAAVVQFAVARWLGGKDSTGGAAASDTPAAVAAGTAAVTTLTRTALAGLTCRRRHLSRRQIIFIQRCAGGQGHSHGWRA